MSAISIILPTKQRNHPLPIALDSILRQTFRDFEVLLVDNNRTENRVSGEPELEPYLDEPRVRLIEYPEGSTAAMVRNRALPEAEGNYVTYLDDDDEYFPTKLEKQIALIEETDSPLVTCGFVYRICGRRRFRQHRADGFSGDELLLEVIPTAQVLFHVNDGAARWDTELGTVDDVCFFHDLVDRFQISRVPNCAEPLVQINIHNESRTNIVPLNLYRGRRRVFVNHGHRFRARARKIYLLRHLIGIRKFESGDWKRFLGVATALIMRGGKREIRPVLNAICVKIPWIRRFVVT